MRILVLTLMISFLSQGVFGATAADDKGRGAAISDVTSDSFSSGIRLLTDIEFRPGIDILSILDRRQPLPHITLVGECHTDVSPETREGMREWSDSNQIVYLNEETDLDIHGAFVADLLLTWLSYHDSDATLGQVAEKILSLYSNLYPEIFYICTQNKSTPEKRTEILCNLLLKKYSSGGGYREILRECILKWFIERPNPAKLKEFNKWQLQEFKKIIVQDREVKYHISAFLQDTFRTFIASPDYTNISQHFTETEVKEIGELLGLNPRKPYNAGKLLEFVRCVRDKLFIKQFMKKYDPNSTYIISLGKAHIPGFRQLLLESIPELKLEIEGDTERPLSAASKQHTTGTSRTLKGESNSRESNIQLMDLLTRIKK